MNKQEFIDRLRAALNGRVSPGLVTENVNYYEDYINMEIRKGRSEAEVLQMLGDPRLIAKTIIDTNSKDGQNVQNDYREAENNSYRGEQYRNQQYQDMAGDSVKTFRMPGWLWAVIGILIVGVILSAVFSVLSFLAPIIIPILVVMFLVKLFRDWLN